MCYQKNCSVRLTQSCRKTQCELTCVRPSWCEPVGKKSRPVETFTKNLLQVKPNQVQRRSYDKTLFYWVRSDRAGRYLDLRLGRAIVSVLASYVSTSSQIFFPSGLPTQSICSYYYQLQERVEQSCQSRRLWGSLLVALLLSLCWLSCWYGLSGDTLMVNSLARWIISHYKSTTPW